eukprot:CAMPEP_0197235230 /NCGR_PEP_ID=MMETSP1429-20130617/2708_1 /TAXON_ID=49237 /ORGANISM="Chaetoceros  sp., Strain UNC1202" /LENGTH=249 /DNA_ID=CAMNT_0042693771 /DNA_START=107 /DNA_END=856 /DNA_ORIENTATION=-
MNDHNQGGQIDPDDPLLIAQTLTYVTDNGSVIMSYSSSPFSLAFKFRLVALEILFVSGLFYVGQKFGAHSLILWVAITNLLIVAWFWYNSVRSVEVTTDGALRFWIGNIEIDVPFDKIVEMRRITGQCTIFSCGIIPHRGYLTTPADGVAIITSVPSTPFFMWPRSAGRPERRLGPFTCPRLKIVFSPNTGALDFLREIEDEMRASLGGERSTDRQSKVGGMTQPPAFDNRVNMGGNGSAAGVGEFYDV